jgi:transporter family protein
MNWLVWSLLSAVFAALTAILAKAGVSGIDANLATAIRTSVVVVFTWVMVVLTGAKGIGAIPGRSWGWLMLSGIATGLSWICYFHALRIGEAGRVAPIDKLSVVLVIVLAALFLGERITAAKGLGALLIAAGAIVIARG